MSKSPKKVEIVGIKREPGYLYFIKDNRVCRIGLARLNMPIPQEEIVVPLNFKRKRENLYYLDGDGDISCVKRS